MPKSHFLCSKLACRRISGLVILFSLLTLLAKRHVSTGRVDLRELCSNLWNKSGPLSLSVLLFILPYAIFPTPVRGETAKCYDSYLLQHYYYEAFQVESAYVVFNIPKSLENNNARARLFSEDYGTLRRNLWDQETRVERYECALLDIATLSEYDPERLKALYSSLRSYLRNAPPAIQQTDFFLMLDTYLETSMQKNIALMNQTVSQISEVFNEKFRNVLTLNQLYAMLQGLANLPIEAPSEKLDFFKETPFSVYGDPNAWQQIRGWLGPFEKASKVISEIGDYRDIFESSWDIIITTFFVPILANEAAIKRLEVISEAASEDPHFLGNDIAFQLALDSTREFLLKSNTEQAFITMWTELGNNFTDLLSNGIELYKVKFSPIIINCINGMLAKPLSITAAAHWAIGIGALIKEFLLFLDITEQHENAEMSVVSATIASALCSKTDEDCMFSVPASYAYLASSQYVIEAFDWEPLILWNLFSDFDEVVEMWEQARKSFGAFLDIEYTYNCDKIPPGISNFWQDNDTSANIYVIFSENVTQADLTNQNIVVMGSVTGAHVCTFEYNDTTFSVKIDPSPANNGSDDFAPNEKVTVTISGISDLAGNVLPGGFTAFFIVEANGGPDIIDLEAYQNDSIVTTQRISGTFELRTRITFDNEITESQFFYSTDSGNIWSVPIPMDVDNDAEWRICVSKGFVDTTYYDLGKNGDEPVLFKVLATDSAGQTAEERIGLTINNVQNVFYLSPANIQIFQLSGTPEPVSSEIILENLGGSWKMTRKPDFLRVQYLDDSLPTWNWVYVGTETEVAKRYNKIRLEIVKDINRQPGTYTGEVVFEDLGTGRTASLSVKFIYASELPMNFDLEIPREPVPVDADGNRLYAPFQENQTVYWQYTIKNNGPDTLPPTPNEIKNGFFVSPSRYDEPVNRPPSSQLRDERTAGNLDPGESRTYSDSRVTFTADDVGKDLYLISIADWMDRVGEGSYAYETNNYAVYGPFRVLPLPKPDFGLGLDPGSFNLPVNRLKATTVYVTAVDGFSDPVELTVSGVPSGMAYSFGATPILPNQQTSLTLLADENVPHGTYAITVAGTGGGKSHSVQATVEVVEGGPPTLEITTNSGQDFETPDGQVVLEGTASDEDSGLLSLTCNMSGTNQGSMENWMFTVDLAPGNNTIVVTATDLVGNTTQRNIHVYSTLTALQVSPEQAKIKSLGATAQLQAVAFNSAGKSADFTTEVTWVSSDPGTATVSASGMVTAIAEGSATVTAEISGLTDACEVIVDTRPFIGVNKSSLSFSATYGLANPYPQTLEIWNDGGQLVNWNLSENATWLFLSETGGSSEGLDNIDKVEVSVNIVGLAVGEYSCEIELSSPEAANSPIIIPVHLIIYPDNPFLQLLYPYDHKTTATLRPLFCWYGREIEGDYTLTIYEGEGAENPIHVHTSADTSYQVPEGTLAGNKTYSWQVSAVRNGSVVESALFVFQTAAVSTINIEGIETTLYEIVMNPSADAHVGTGGIEGGIAWPSSNYGSRNTLAVGVDNAITYSSYVNFDIYQNIPTHAEINKAQLELFVVQSSSASHGLSLYNASNAWAENTITWNNQPGPSGDNFAYLDEIDTGFLAPIEITDPLKSWLSYAEPFYGIVLVSNAAAFYPYSRESTETYRPVLRTAYYFDPSKAQEIAAIEVIQTEATNVFSGEPLQFSASARDENDNVILDITAFHWQVLPLTGDGSITQGGLFVGTKSGTCIVMASAYGHSGVSGVITVDSGVLDSIVIYPLESQTITLNNPIQFTAQGRDAQGNPISGLDFTWEVSPAESASISDQGIFMATGTGTYHVTASNSGISSDPRAVTVIGGELSSLALSHDGSNTLAIGDKMQFSVIAYDGAGAEITGLTFEWAIEGEGDVADIDANGLVTGLKEGKFRVKVRCGSVSAVSEEITVYCALPADFSQILPENNAVGVSITPTFQWEESRWATSYDVELLRGDGSSGVVIQATTTETSYAVPEYVKLDFSSPYIWRIKAKNQCGQTLSDSEFGFTTEGMRVKAVFWPSDDATIAVSSRDTNYGTATNLICRDTISRNHALLRFDISDLIGREIISAKLQLYLYSKSSTDDGDFYVYAHKVLEEWTENVVTWNNAPSFAETSTRSFIVNRIDAPRVYQIDITDTALDWTDGLSGNYGIILVTNDNEDDTAYFSSSENGSAVQRPRLIVEYRGNLDAEGSVGTYLEPTQALSIYEDEKDLAQVDALIVAGGADIRRRSLLMYDLSALPVEVDNVSAYQCITYRDWGGPDVASNYGTNYQINVYQVTKPWDISDTWSTFGEFGYDADQVHGTLTIGTGPPYDWPANGISYSCDISTLVERWRDEAANHGLMLRGTDEGPNMRRWFYRNNGQAGTLAPYVLIFYDWIKAPEIIETQPEANEELVNIFSPIILKFNRKMDRASVEAALGLSDGVTSVPGAFSWSDDSKVVTFTPDAALSGSTEYIITVTISAMDWTGRPMEQDYQSTFTTMDIVNVPIIGCSKNPILFDASPNQQNAVEKTLDIWNAGQGELHWNISSSVSWLNISPTSGASTGETDTISLIADTSGIESGNYAGEITIECSEAPNSPVIISVSLNVLHADFEVSEKIGTKPFTFTFMDKSTGSILSWSWDFGDGQTSDEQNPTHTYSSAGTFTVRLVIKSLDGTDVCYATVEPGRMYYIDILADSIVTDKFVINDCQIAVNEGSWRLYCDARSNYQENRARVLKTLFYDRRIVDYATNVRKLISCDVKDAGRHGISWDLKVLYYSDGTYHPVETYFYRVLFGNLVNNLVSIWTYAEGSYGSVHEAGSSNWMPANRKLNGYRAWEIHSIERSYVQNELLSDTSSDDYLNPDAVVIVFDSQTSSGGYLSSKGYALSNSSTTFSKSENDGDWKLMSDEAKDFLQNYSIPAFDSPLINVYAFTASASDSQVTLSWKSPNGDSFQGVRIVRKEGTCPTSPTDGEIIYEGNGEMYIDTTVVNGTTYCYKIYSYDGEELYSSGVAATVTPQAGLPPYNPTDFTAEGLDQQVRLSWKNPAYDDFSRVRLLRKTGTYPTGPTDADAVIVYEGTAEYVKDLGLTNHVTYYYRLYTIDKDHLYSSGVEATATPVPPRLLVNLVQLAEESASHMLSLESGWNLVSLPVVPQDKTPETVFSTALDNIVEIGAQNMGYREADTSTENDEWFYPSDIENSHLTRIETERGYWIRTISPCNVEISGRVPYSTSVHLLQKLTRVGFLSSGSEAVEDGFAGLGSWENIIGVIWAYSDGNWLKYDPDALDPSINDLFELQPGSGYDISIEPSYENQIWHYTNSSAVDLTPSREVYASVYNTPDVDIAQVQIDWGDENGWMPLEGNRYHTYASDGDYIIQVKYGASLATNSMNIDANDPPESTPGNLTISEDTIGMGTLLATDLDNDPLSFSIVSEGAKGSVEITDAATGSFIYTPYEDVNGIDSFTFKVNDGNADSNVATVEINIDPVNDVPINNVVPTINGTLLVGQQLTASTGTWNDDKDTSVGGSSTITYQYRWRRAESSIGANPVDIAGATGPTYTLTATDSGKYIQVVVTATDDGVGTPVNQTASASSAWMLVSNTAPVIGGADPVAVTMDEDGSPTPFGLTLHASDADGDAITWSISTQAAYGTATASGTGSTKNIDYTPADDRNDDVSFIVQVSDANGGTDTVTVNVTIDPINDSPGFVKGPNQTLDENADVQTVSNWATAISAGPYESTQTLAFQVTTDNDDLFSELPEIDSNGTLTYTPAFHASGEATVTVVLKDDGGTDKGGDDTSDPQTFTITVNSTVSDLFIRNSVNNLSPEVGDGVVFTVTVTNNGPESASGVEVLNVFPVSLTNLSGYSDNYDPDTGLWSIGDLANGGSATLTIQCTVSEPGEILSVASITDTYLRDTDLSNQSSAVLLNGGPQTDLAITKSVSDYMPGEGETITFTLKVTNNGTDTATNVQIADVLPAGLGYQTYRASGITAFASSTGLWTVGTLNAGNSATLEIDATVNSVDEIINRAKITNLDQRGPDETNNASSAVLNEDFDAHPSIVDLAVQKRVNRAGVDVGDDVVFTILVRNNGPDDAHNVQIEDVLPEGLLFVTVAPSRGSYDDQTGIWSVGEIPVGSYVIMDLEAIVASAGAQINTSTVRKIDEFDPDDSNNTASATVSGQAADLSVIKSVDPGTFNIGDELTFTVKVTNHGPDDASGVNITDILPSELIYLNDDSPGTYAPATGLWSVGNLADGESASITITVRADQGGAVTNTATRTTSSPADTNDSNDTASVIIGVNRPPEIDQDDPLSVSMDEDGSPTHWKAPAVTASDPDGDAVTWSISVLPLHGQAQVSGTGPSPDVLTYSPNENYHGPDSFELQVVDGLGGTDKITVSITVTSVNDPPIAQNDQYGTNEDTALTLPPPGILSNDSDVDGDTFTSLLDIGPANGALVLNPDGGFTYTPNLHFNGTDSFTYHANDGASDSTIAMVSITVNPVNDAPVGINDSFSVAEGGTFTEPAPGVLGNDTDVENDPMTAELITGVSQGTLTLNPDGSFSYSHDGSENFSDGFTYRVKDTEDGNIAQVTITIIPENDPPVITEGESVSTTMDEDGSPTPFGLTLHATDAEMDAIDWTVSRQAGHGTATASGTGDGKAIGYTPNPDWNGSDSFDVQISDGNGGTDTITVHVTLKSVNDAPGFTKGTDQTVGYDSGPQTVQNWATNMTPGPANESDQNLNFVESTDNPDLFLVRPDVDPQTGDLTYTPAPYASGVALVEVVLKDDGGTLNGGVDASGSQTFTITVNEGSSDIAVVTSVDDLAPQVGQNVVFTIRVVNRGPDDVRGLQILDSLASGLSYVNDDSGGLYDPASGIWNIGQLSGTAPNNSAVLNVTCTAVLAGQTANIASIADSDLKDPDATNNSSALVLNAGPQADLALAKTVDNEKPFIGESITYTITVANNSLNHASGVVVTDILPEGLIYQSSTVSKGTYDPGTGVWTLGDLEAGSSVSLDLTAEVESDEEIINTARTTHMDQHDPDPTNNVSSVMINQDVVNHELVSDLAVHKSVNIKSAGVGDRVVFTILMRNNGPDVAHNVEIVDIMTEGLAFVRAETSQGLYDEQTGIWPVGDIPAGSYALLDLETEILNTGAQSNTSTIGYSEEFDPDVSNNTASATVSGEAADLSVTKSVNDGTFNIGDALTFTVKVTNHGPDDASGVNITDILPSELVYLNDDSPGTYAPATGLWSVGNLANGESASIKITVRADQGGAITNTATRTSSSPADTNSANDTATVMIGVNRPPEIDQDDPLSVSMDEDGSPTPWVEPILTASDPDGNALTWAISVLPLHGTAQVSGTGPSPDVLTYSPNENYHGPDSFELQVSDGLGGTDKITVNITVTSINDPPIAQNDQYMTNEDTALTLPSPGILSNDSDVDGDTFTALLDIGPANGALILNPDGGFTYTPNLHFNGTDNFTYHANDGASDSNIAMVLITVNPVNDAPGFTKGADVQVDENSGPRTFPTWATDIRPGPSDESDQKLTFEITTTNDGLFDPGPAIDPVTGDLTFTPARNTFGRATANVALKDDGGTSNGGVDTSEPQTFTITVNEIFSDVSIEKTVNYLYPNVGEDILYTLILTNKGPNDVDEVEVLDFLPLGLTYLYDTSEGTYDPETGKWTIAFLPAAPPDNTHSIDISAQVTHMGDILNVAGITHSALGDLNIIDNSSAISLNKDIQTDLVIEKTVDRMTASIGDKVCFTIKVTNNGPEAATGVGVTDILPEGLKYSSNIPSRGTYEPATGMWNLGDLEAGSSAVLELTAEVTNEDEVINTCRITHNDQTDPDATNNQASRVINQDLLNHPAVVDLSIQKTVNTPHVKIGDEYVFRVLVRNNGPADTIETTVEDLLPEGLVFVSSKTSQGSYDDQIGLWEIGTMKPGLLSTLDIVARLAEDGEHTNTAKVISVDQYDLNDENNSSSVMVSPLVAFSDIKANGQDGPITVSPSAPVSVTIGMYPGEYTGFNADWWVAVNTPFDPPGDWYTYVYPAGWMPGVNLCVQTPLFEFSGFEVLNMVLPVGTYTFYFALDSPDGMVTADLLDSVEVHVE